MEVKNADGSSGGSPVFDEVALRKEIERVWGAHGAHAEVYSMLLRENAKLREALDLLLPLQSYAINGTKGGAKGVADTEYRFNKARALSAPEGGGR